MTRIVSRPYRVPGALFLLAAVLSTGALAQTSPGAAARTETPALTPERALRALPGETILLRRLNGIAFYATAAAASAGAPGQGIALHGLPLLQNAGFQAIVSHAGNAPASRDSLERLLVATRVYLGQLGYPFSVVYLPPQDITSGIVRVVVTLSRMQGAPEIEGARYFSPDLYRRAIRNSPERPLNLADMKADIDWINRNEFRSAKVTTVAGTEPATTKVLVSVEEKFPLTFTLGADNTGTASTRENRLNGGIKWGNAFGLGDTLALNLSMSPDVRTFQSISGSYAIDLPWRHVLTFSGAYSRTNGIVASPFSLKGETWQISADYLIPLTSSVENYTQSLTFGIDLKSSNNNFAFSSIPISNTPTKILQARATYTGGYTGRFGATAFDATVVASPGNLLTQNSDAAFNLSRAGAKADYVYVRGNASQTVPLDFVAPGFSWFIRGKAQLSNRNLIGSEQFQGGGANAVRGYQEDAVYKDNGFLLSQELRFPPVRFDLGRAPVQWQAFAFQDFARLQSTSPLPGETAANLHGLGIGFTLAAGPWVNLRVSYGWRMSPIPGGRATDKSRLHFSQVVSF